MPYRHHRPLSRLVPLFLGCAAAALAGTTVTIGNHSGLDLWIARSGDAPANPILVSARSDETPGVFHPFCPEPQAPSEKSPELFGPSSVPARRVFLLKNGDAATFRYEQEGCDQTCELVLFHEDEQNGFDLRGVVTFAVTHRPAGPDQAPEPEARLSLPAGPIPRTRTIPANRTIQAVSDQELKILPRAARGLPGEKESKAVQPLG